MLCETYWNDRGKDRASSATILGQLAALRRHIGKDRKLSTITNETILDYRAARRGDRQPKPLNQQTVNREITLLRAAMNHVASLYEVAVPRLKWKMLFFDEPSPRSRYLTFEEWAVLLEAAHQSVKPILICAVTTGLRKSNILKLDWSQVNLSARRITLKVKGDKNHQPRITALLFAALSTIPHRKGGVFDATNFEKRWDKAVSDSGLADLRFHDLRHTFASWARQSGADIADVKEALGHSDISMTMRYAHIKPDAEDTAFDRVSAALTAHSAPQSLQKRQN